VKVKSRLLLAVVAGMLAASTVGVAAQEEGPSFFEVTMNSSGPPTEPTPGESGPGWEGYLGLADADVAVDAGDPRASGLLDQVRNGTDMGLPTERVGIQRSAVRLVNDQGSWVGEGTMTMRLEQGPPTHLAALWRFEGEGAYDGLVLELHSFGSRVESPQSIVWGVIYPAEAVPPAPEAIAAE
jgi:hypothetical protein